MKGEGNQPLIHLITLSSPFILPPSSPTHSVHLHLHYTQLEFIWWGSDRWQGSDSYYRNGLREARSVSCLQDYKCGLIQHGFLAIVSCSGTVIYSFAGLDYCGVLRISSQGLTCIKQQSRGLMANCDQELGR